MIRVAALKARCRKPNCEPRQNVSLWVAEYEEATHLVARIELHRGAVAMSTCRRSIARNEKMQKAHALCAAEKVLVGPGQGWG